MVLYSIGHSTRPLYEFLRLLAESGVEIVVDVRRIPHSRHVPHFEQAALQAALSAAPRPLRYVHVPNLGGLRKRRPGSINTAWRSGGFQGYADYMQTPEFERALRELLDLAETGRVAMMCAEALPWRCHRRLVADVLAAWGHEVRHIMGPGDVQPHRLTPFAKIAGGCVTYPRSDALQGRLP